MRMPQISHKQKLIAAGIGLFIFVVVSFYISYKVYELVVNHFIDKKVSSSSNCISKELRNEAVSTDVLTCLCNEFGGNGYIFEVEPGVQVNACVIQGDK